MKSIFLKKSIFCILFFILCFGLKAQDVTTLLEADGPGGTYQLLSSTFGGTPYEVPDCDHDPAVDHITETFDNELNKNVFQFDIHKDVDTDRCETNTDRQRNEIKTYDPSGNELKAVKNELVIYEWKFKLDENFTPTNRFCHLFQIKAKGGSDDSNPVITISAYLSSAANATPALRIIYSQGDNPPSGSEYVTVSQTDLTPFLGKWINARCEVFVNEASTTIEDGQVPGSVNLSLDEAQSGTNLLTYINEDIDMLREGSNVFLRPKWGIYRSLESTMPLRDETVYFADFSITEKEQTLSSTEFSYEAYNFHPNPVKDILYFDNPNHLEFLLYDLNGKLLATTHKASLDLTELERGIYLLRSSETHTSSFQKIIKF